MPTAECNKAVVNNAMTSLLEIRRGIFEVFFANINDLKTELTELRKKLKQAEREVKEARSEGDKARKEPEKESDC